MLAILSRAGRSSPTTTAGMQEFEPRGETFQPDWSREIMTDYFAEHSEDPR